MIDGLCLKRESSPNASDYAPWNRTITLRAPAPVSGEIGALSHEICHAHQHWAILQAGIPDIAPNDRNGPGFFIKFLLNTQQGQEYMVAGGYSFLGLGGECTRESLPACYTVDRTKCEMGFCIPEYPNPFEDNAQFCATWYNPGGLPNWGPDNLTRNAPRRAAWARLWLP